MKANSHFTILAKLADSSEDAHKMLVLEAQIAGRRPTSLRHQLFSKLLRDSKWMVGSKNIVWQIEIMIDLSDHVAAHVSLSGNPLRAFSSKDAASDLGS
jgi:hypothetical protein